MFLLPIDNCWPNLSIAFLSSEFIVVNSLISILYFLAMLQRVSPSDTICISYGINVLDFDLLKGINKVSFTDNKSLFI